MDKCEFCGDAGWISIRQTYSFPAGEQEQCPLCGCRDEIKRLTECGRKAEAQVKVLREALEEISTSYCYDSCVDDCPSCLARQALKETSMTEPIEQTNDQTLKGD